MSDRANAEIRPTPKEARPTGLETRETSSIILGKLINPFEKGSQQREDPLFPEASDEAQVIACFCSLREITRKYQTLPGTITDKEKRHVRAYTGLLQKLVSKNEPLPTGVGQAVVRTTTALLDHIFVDEIKKNMMDNHFGKDSYFREYGYYTLPERDFTLYPDASPIFGTRNEITHLSKRISGIPKTAAVEDGLGIAKLQSTPEGIMTNGPLDTIALSSFLEAAFRLYPEAAAFGQFHLSDKVSGVMIQNAGLNAFHNYRGLFYPRTEVPRQEIWKSLLTSGKILFSTIPLSKQMLPDVRTHSSDIPQQEILDKLETFMATTPLPEDAPSYKRRHLRKSRIYVESNSEQIQEYAKRHTEHYKRVISSREHPVYRDAEVLLTRSGVSANEAAIRAIKKHVGDSKVIAYAFPGFYYENLSFLDDHFDVSPDPDEAQVFLLNDEPNEPVFADAYPSPYVTNRDKLQQTLIERAQNNPDKKYYLVYDKTTNLLHETFAESDNLPPNLTIFETASLSKHQRGGKNYFYGILSAWGDPSLHALLPEAVREAQGELTEQGVIHLPRLTQHEIQERRAEVQAQNVLIAETIANLQEDAKLAPTDQWKVQQQSFFTYILPPESMLTYLNILRASDDTASIEQLDFATFIKMTTKTLGFDPSLLTIAGTLTEHYATIEDGESFGLDKTRIGAIFLQGTDYPENMMQGKTAENLIPRNMGILRISPGSLTPDWELKSYTSGLIRNAIAQLKLIKQKAQL